MDIEQPPNFSFPNKPKIATTFRNQLQKVQTNHFPISFDFKNSHVYSYHLKILPEIPEDSRQLR